MNNINYKKYLIKKIKTKKAIIGVIGLGYVGLPLAILFAKKKFKVFGFDIDKNKIKKIKKKKSYIEKISSKDISLLTKSNYCFDNFEKINSCDILIICVPTPLSKGNKPDLSYIKNTFQSIKGKLNFGQAIVLESTSYPGTTEEEIVSKLNKKFLVGKNLFVGFSSERINPGVNENNIQSIPKVVSGHSKSCLEVTENIYNKVFKKTVKTKNLKIAEFSKLLENIYRAVNIGFINEMKLVADKMGIDIFEIIKVANTKPYGFRRFHPGPGIGGHCIPIDPHYLYWKAKKFGISANFIKLSAETNTSVINFIKRKINKIVKSKKIKKPKILILGMAYKKNMDDIRESASIKLIEKLNKIKFYKIQYHDPHLKSIILNKNLEKIKKIKKISSNKIKKFDIVVLMTDHDVFDYKMLLQNSKLIIDCRGRYKVNNKVIRA